MGEHNVIGIPEDPADAEGLRDLAVAWGVFGDGRGQQYQFATVMWRLLDRVARLEARVRQLEAYQ